MSRTALANGAALLAAVALAVLGASGRALPGVTSGEPEVAEVPSRIVSASTVADRLLFDFCPPDRVVAITERSTLGPQAHRFVGHATVRSLDDLEAIVALRPDVLLASNVDDPRRVARIRDAGVEVVELGSSDGLASLLSDVRTVARLCGVPDGGARYADALERRMGGVARDVTERREGIYLSIYGDRNFGGTVGSSYHDVLTAAGLEDAAAEAYRGWPQYTIEQLLELDPEVIVTRAGMRATICGHPALSHLSACPDDVVEIDGELLDDPGPGMLDAAEAIHDAVYGAGRSGVSGD